MTEAASYYAESLAYELALNHALGVALALNNHGEAVEMSGSPQIALRCFAGAARLFQEGGSLFMTLLPRSIIGWHRRSLFHHPKRQPYKPRARAKT